MDAGLDLSGVGVLVGWMDGWMEGNGRGREGEIYESGSVSQAR